MAYTADKPRLARSSDELRQLIAGWGVDLDPKDRPAVPKERFRRGQTGARWDFPDRQPETFPRERSPEHKFLPPVFGTACPPRGLSGALRRYAYRLSEGRASHWLLLMAADRADVLESRIGGILRARPDNPIAESGVLSEVRRHGLRSRFGHQRADLKHQPIDLLLAAAPWVAGAALLYAVSRRTAPAAARLSA